MQCMFPSFNVNFISFCAPDALSNLKCLQCHLLMLKHNSSSYFLQWTQSLHLLFAKGVVRERKGTDSTVVNVPSPFKKQKTKTCRVSMFFSKLCSLSRTVFSNYQQIIWSFFSSCGGIQEIALKTHLRIPDISEKFLSGERWHINNLWKEQNAPRCHSAHVCELKQQALSKESTDFLRLLWET